MKKSITRLVAVASVCLGATSAFALDLPTTGTCGFTAGANYPFTSGQTVGTAALNMMGTINFSTKTIQVNFIEQAFDSRTTVTAQRFVNTQDSDSVTFTAVPSTVVAGMHVLTLPDLGKLNLLPVNNGKTVLMQFYSADALSGHVGVCQF